MVTSQKKNSLAFAWYNQQTQTREKKRIRQVFESNQSFAFRYSLPAIVIDPRKTITFFNNTFRRD